MSNQYELARQNMIEYNKGLTEYVSHLQARSSLERKQRFCSLRAFDEATVDEAGIFYIGDMAEMLLPSFIDRVGELGVISETNKKPIFRGRWVIPIKDENGLVQNLVGYSPDADERYIYGTSKYYRRRETLYGLENLEMAYDLGYAFVTEGITDTIRLRDIGYKNSFAMCGTTTSPHVLKQLNRCRHGVILIPDRDKAGRDAHKNWIYNRSITIFVNFRYKDLDEMCSVYNEETNSKEKNLENITLLSECADYCIDWILSGQHNGYECERKQVTIA